MTLPLKQLIPNLSDGEWKLLERVLLESLPEKKTHSAQSTRGMSNETLKHYLGFEWGHNDAIDHVTANLTRVLRGE